MKVTIDKFSGIVPRYSPELLNNELATVAENLSIKSGKVHPEFNFEIKKPDKDYVPGMVNDDQYERLYSVGDDGVLNVHSNRGTFPAAMPAPGAPVLEKKESVVFETFLGNGKGKLWYNYGSSIKADPGDEGRKLLSEKRLLEPLEKDGDWIAMPDGWRKDYALRDKYIVEWTITGKDPLYELNPCTYIIERDPKDEEEEEDLETLGEKMQLTAIGFVSQDYPNYIEKYPITNFRGEQVGTAKFYHKSLPVDVLPPTSLEGFLHAGKQELNTGGGYNRTDYAPKNLRMCFETSYTDITRSFYYVARFVDETGAEGPPSEISKLIERKPDERLRIKIPVDNAGGYVGKIVKVRLYRSAGGTSASDYLFLGEMELGAGEIVFADDIPESELSEPMPVWGNPPEGLKGIVGMSGGFMAGFEGSNIWFSEPYLPCTWPYSYNQSVGYPIVGVAVRSNYLYIMTTGQLYALVGDAPEQMTPVNLRFDMPCISRASIAYVAGSIVYAGATGLVIISNGGPSVFSNAYFTTEQYKALQFENCKAAGEYDGKYFAVFDNITYLFDFVEQSLTTLNTEGFTLGSYGAEQWPTTEFLNAPFGNVLIKQSFSGDRLSARWHSKTYVFPRPVAFSSVRIRCYGNDGGQVHLKLFAEDRQVAETYVTLDRAVRLPVLRRECRWSFELASKSDIEALEISESMAEM